MNRFLTAHASLLLTALSCMAFSNPVIHGDLPDPSIIRVDSIYYATGTSSEWAPYYPIYRSSDLVNWSPVGHVFNKQPQWTVSSFWAPEFYRIGDTFYVYYTARRRTDNGSYIGVATSDRPEGPYTDHGPIVQYGSEAIDAFIFEDTDGRRYISWKAYGLDPRPIELLACQLAPDGLSTTGEPFTLMRDDEGTLMEGHDIFRHGDYYYILYSIRNCCGFKSDYAVSAARSHSLKGPYERCPDNPVLHGGNSEIRSVGHGTLVTLPDLSIYYLCHAYLEGVDFILGRQPVLYEVAMDSTGWPKFVEGHDAKLSSRDPFPDTVQLPAPDFHDDFSSPVIGAEWSYNYPYSDVVITLEDSTLYLSGKAKGTSESGAALCLRPAYPSYALSAGLEPSGHGICGGLTLYGDGDNYIVFGRYGSNLQLRLTAAGKTDILADIPVKHGKLDLQMYVDNGTPVRFAWSYDSHTWHTADIAAISAEALNSLNRWDRVIRPGLIHEGNAGKPAAFSYCRINYSR